MSKKLYGSGVGELEIVRLIFAKARARKGGRRVGPYVIARELNEAGKRTRGGRLWSGQAVINILGRGMPDMSRGDYAKKTQLSPNDFLGLADVGRVLANKELRDIERMVFAIGVFSGLRAAEICCLQLRDLPIVHGKNIINVRRGKGCKQRAVQVSVELTLMLNEFCNKWHLRGAKKTPLFINIRGRALSYDSLYRIVKETGRKAGLFDLHPHKLRHTFATILYNCQKDLFFLKEQLGHSSLDSTRIYTNIPDESKNRQMRAFAEMIAGSNQGDLAQSRTENTGKLALAT